MDYRPFRQTNHALSHLYLDGGWSDGAKVLGKLPVSGRPTYLDYSRARAYCACKIGAGGGCLDIFSLNYHFSFLSPSLWETARYRLKYCLKGPLNAEQPTNQMYLDVQCRPCNLRVSRANVLGISVLWFI